jgi:hypothetical protein
LVVLTAIVTAATMFPFTRYEDGKAAIDWLCRAVGKYVVVEDVDAHCRQAKAAGAERPRPRRHELRLPRVPRLRSGGQPLGLRDVPTSRRDV